MKLLTMTLLAALGAGTAQADGSHGHAHGATGSPEGGLPAMGHMDHAGEAMPLGAPASAAAEARTVTVTMRETDDGRMIFEPGSLSFARGETVRLVIRNEGEQEHEFVMDTPDGIEEHKAMMADRPDMMHQEANALRLASGESGEILWTFGDPGSYAFACLIPGHYEGGMHGPLTVR
ncbi:plastocyanin/azurin family copper-binding protein [Cereibacter johrii]|uniref:Cupredoxin-like copper-binding protein n=1 Tax=Cereibacter johrii TaxID=445629 RepID=A0ABX5J726_9RHOB|nr:cupredoxin family protein [Cereibacter johrii]ODM41852.1 copper oxidase [Cereibacter johrii]PTM78302.1 putative cupredoxin-like copper-binding protein [Cereibacter johrii]